MYGSGSGGGTLPFTGIGLTILGHAVGIPQIAALGALLIIIGILFVLAKRRSA